MYMKKKKRSLAMTVKEQSLLVVKKSRNGKGVFARRAIAAGETILQVRGALITCYEDDDLDEQTRSNTYRYDEELYLSPVGTVGELLNHSCAPNAKVEKRGSHLYIVSIQPILRGVEICFDYSTILAKDDSWTMPCNCGTGACRKLVRGFHTLPKRVRDAYLSQGMVPSYIIEN